MKDYYKFFICFALLAAIFVHIYLHDYEVVDTIYGRMRILDPVLLDLLRCPAMQRLKHVHQLSFGGLFGDDIPYSRYDHSVGVLYLLRLYGATREEQVAGLLHDVSHTVFSHFGDLLFDDDKGYEREGPAYQDRTHGLYINQTWIPAILEKHGVPLRVADILSGRYPMLRTEWSRHALSADRLEYNLYEGLMRGRISHDVLLRILNDLAYDDDRTVFVFGNASVARLFADLPLYFTEHTWGARGERLRDLLMLRGVRRAMHKGLVSRGDMRHSTADVVMGWLLASEDFMIQDSLRLARKYRELYKEGTDEEHDLLVKTKFRGIDPWVRVNDTYAIVRLSAVDEEFATEYHAVWERMRDGWPLVFTGEVSRRPLLMREMKGEAQMSPIPA